MRFLNYLLLPVPVAMVPVLTMILLVGGPSEVTPRVVAFYWLAGLLFGYSVTIVQSALFAGLMMWLERRRVDVETQCVAAAIFGCLGGVSVGPWVEEATVLFAILGALVGPIVVGIVFFLAGSGHPRAAVHPLDSGLSALNE